jgi:hypothetical protein
MWMHIGLPLVWQGLCKRGYVDHTMYSTSSMRTIELILGLPPMSQYDAAATPMCMELYAHCRHRPFAVVLRPVSVGLK